MNSFSFSRLISKSSATTSQSLNNVFFPPPPGCSPYPMGKPLSTRSLLGIRASAFQAPIDYQFCVPSITMLFSHSRVTYKAFIERVVDGDTLIVKIDLGFETRIREYLRLRGIDAPETDTAEGKRSEE